jgi:hypothetical protein
MIDFRTVFDFVELWAIFMISRHKGILVYVGNTIRFQQDDCDFDNRGELTSRQGPRANTFKLIHD